MAEIQDTVDAIDAEVERIPDSEAERRAEVEEAGINEPVMHEPQAEPELESAWQPGTDSGHTRPPPTWKRKSRCDRRGLNVTR